MCCLGLSDCERTNGTSSVSEADTQILQLYVRKCTNSYISAQVIERYMGFCEQIPVAQIEHQKIRYMHENITFRW